MLLVRRRERARAPALGAVVAEAPLPLLPQAEFHVLPNRW